MKAIKLNIGDWLRQEAHVAVGQSFQFENCSCVPVVPETHTHDATLPVGFLVTHGADVAFVPAETPDGEQILAAWSKNHVFEEAEDYGALPAECWYG